MTVPARWRFITENDHLTSWQCEGDGVDLCRAPATWVAETERPDKTLRILTQRCPDHIPVRALAGSTLPAPPSASLQPAPVFVGEPKTPTVEPLASLPVRNTPVTPDVETAPALADTQEADKFKSPAPPAEIGHDLDEDD